jgi:hypothetical protein
MLRRTLLLLIAAAAAASLPPEAARRARAQTSLRPDPTPRLPPQPGQGLPVEDVRFLRDAAALSAAQAEAGAAFATGGGDGGGGEETGRFAAALAERHRRLAQEIAELARQRGVELSPRQAGDWPSERIAAPLRRLEGLKGAGQAGGGDSARAFLAAELEVHPLLVQMYQAQASDTPDRDLGRFAITTLVGLQEDFATTARLGQRHGLAPPAGLLANPPQYGPGAGPPRR